MGRTFAKNPAFQLRRRSRSAARASLVHEGVTLLLAADSDLRIDRRKAEGLVVGTEGPELHVPCVLRRRGGRSWIEGATAAGRARKIDRVLVDGLRRAHRELRATGTNLLLQRPDWPAMSGIPDPYINKLSRLAFLAPDIQQAIMDGRQPFGLMLQQLREAEIPACWVAQRRLFGFEAI